MGTSFFPDQKPVARLEWVLAPVWETVLLAVMPGNPVLKPFLLPEASGPLARLWQLVSFHLPHGRVDSALRAV